MGNGNIFDYAELVIEACTGEVSKVQFDESSFRVSRAKANQALATLSTIGLGGKELGQYKTDQENWFATFPDHSHLIRIQVNKMNHHSDKVKPFAEREYTCEHTEAGE